ncbi:DeoR/GlpR family DNA-binding transcription regulator [Microbacterium indicum]|uniref:DeoR/GlpR family DNA-binding transcription regulator n=1 Tax=Microbacterium indicum TaxID=358100 RepID=UPI00041D9DD9|nr:DeoR/GlpR family DNA-binding transcription regulator [Microbacterium indicum]
MDTDKSRTRRHPAGRKAELLAYVTSHGHVTVGELAAEFEVSIDTIRRDLDQLDADNKLVRTHGGAVSADQGAPPDEGLSVRMRVRAPEKETIGRLAAEQVADGSVVIINSGTTTLALGRNLGDKRDLTIATNSLVLPSELSSAALRELLVFGGSVRTITQATTGPVSFRAMLGGPDLDVAADVAFIGVGAVDDAGYTSSNLADAAMMSEMMTHARRTIILADSSKFDQRLFARIAPLATADALITGRRPTGALADALAEAGVEVIAPE